MIKNPELCWAMFKLQKDDDSPSKLFICNLPANHPGAEHLDRDGDWLVLWQDGGDHVTLRPACKAALC
jgi:hypothetical protein